VVAGRRRRGIGKRAILLLEDRLRAQGVTLIGLKVFADNAGALALYEALGDRTTSHGMHKVL
jgi:ribosomal protein S18 acetylase RimI-like enzyme